SATGTPGRSVEENGGTQVRIQILRVDAQATPAPPVAFPSNSQVRIELMLYSLDRESARRILAQTHNPAESYAAIRELLGKGGAQLDLISAFVTKLGQRAVNEEIAEVRYPVSTIPPDFDSRSTPAQRGPASFGAFETRNTGVTGEAESVGDAEGRFVDINIVPQIVRLTGMLKTDGVASRYPPQ